MKTKSFFFATDKDIYDALSSKKKRFTKDVLIDICKKRGILISTSEIRSDLISYISMLPHDFNDVDSLMKLIIANTRSERKTSSEIQSEISNSNINSVVNTLKRDREKYGEKYTVITEAKDKVIIKVEYSIQDFGMTRLRQRFEKEDYIEILKENGVTKFRRPANERNNEIFKDLIKEVKRTNSDTIKEQDISLSGFKNPELRTLFFVKLVNGIENMDLSDVTHIRVSSFKEANVFEESEYSDESKGTKEVLIGHVKRAALDGVGLLYSAEYQSLKERGFFISSITWNSIEKSGIGDKIQFEASFEFPEECNSFVYNVRGFYKKGLDGYSNTKYPLKDLSQSSYLRLIESSAKNSFEECLSQSKG